MNILNILLTILSFVVTIGILVAVHEFGHFWVARKLGIKVLRFAIGFGTPLWTYTSKKGDKTEYTLAAIPFGGYVKMLDEREGDVPKEDVDRAFNRQPVWKRFLVVLAGPVFNFIFAIAAFALTYMIGMNAVRPYIGTVAVDTPAAVAGFQEKDQVLAINGIKTDSLSSVRLLLLNEYLESPQIDIKVKTTANDEVVRHLDLSSVKLLAEEGNHMEKTGINFWHPPHVPIIMNVLADSAAAEARLEEKDVILSYDNIPATSVETLTQYIQQHAGKTVTLMVKRGDTEKALHITPKPSQRDGKTIGLMGVHLAKQLTDKDKNDLFFIHHASFGEALSRGAIETWRMSMMTLKVMGRLITGEASLKNISGPITIAKYAGISASIGFTVYLSFLAVISLSLGVLNLLPIPMLDGGHLFYYIIEIIKGSPVSAKFESMGAQVGMVMVGMLMVIAVYNDVMRIVG
ncbi:MAG: RIP metalloprotease RseP [Cocleimonas sp.]|nr:RIP metalloprotease RseP [Cocleimonas sp.]